jgi:hypothetical protein
MTAWASSVQSISGDVVSVKVNGIALRNEVFMVVLLPVSSGMFIS